MASISQYEINLQVSATLEKIAFELNKSKSDLVALDSKIESAHLTIGEVAKLHGLNEFGYNCFYDAQHCVQVPDQYKVDLSSVDVTLQLLNHDYLVSSCKDTIFKMSYDMQDGSYLTCYLANSIAKYRHKPDVIKTVVLYYKRVNDITKLWIIDKVNKTSDLSSPQWPYIYCSKVALFPIDKLGISEGVYGPYFVNCDRSYWRVDQEKDLSSYIYKALKESLSATVKQSFNATQINQLWENLVLGDPNVDFVDIFYRTLDNSEIQTLNNGRRKKLWH